MSIQVAPCGQHYVVARKPTQIVSALVQAANKGILSLVVARHQWVGTAVFKLKYDHEKKDDQWVVEFNSGFLSYQMCADAAEKANARILSGNLSL